MLYTPAHPFVLSYLAFGCITDGPHKIVVKPRGSPPEPTWSGQGDEAIVGWPRLGWLAVGWNSAGSFRGKLKDFVTSCFLISRDSQRLISGLSEDPVTSPPTVRDFWELIRFKQEQLPVSQHSAEVISVPWCHKQFVVLTQCFADYQRLLRPNDAPTLHGNQTIIMQ